MPQIIVAGNPVDGFTFTGPFLDVDEAIRHNADGDWWVADLQCGVTS